MPLALLVPRRLVMGLTLLLASACSLGAGRAPDATPTPVAPASTPSDGVSLPFLAPGNPLVLDRQPVTRTLALTPTLRQDIARAGALVLHLDDLRLGVEQALVLRVFAQHPDAQAGTSVESPRFLGYLAVPGQTHRDVPTERRLHLTLDVSATLPALLAGRDQLTLTLVPATAGGQAPRPASPVHIGRMSLSLEPALP